MRNVWSKISAVVLGSLIIFIIVPLIVAIVTTAHVIDVNTESQWIGFCGNYLGALIGGAISGSITLYVLFRTLEDNKKTLETTLQNGRNIQEHNEKLKFCNMLTEKNSKVMPGIVDVIYKAHHYVLLESMEYLFAFSSQLRAIEGELVSLIMQVEVVEEEMEYTPEKAKNFVAKVEKLRNEISEYYKLVMIVQGENKETKLEENEKKIELLANEMTEELIQYQRLLLQEKY